MRVNEFLASVAQQTRAALPRPLQAFHVRGRFTLVQLYYDKRTLHYEVWVRGQPHLLEVGLHLESDRATNARLLDYFRSREIEIRAELGPRVELEQWTTTWARIHQVLPYQALDAECAASTAAVLAQIIALLQPMLVEALEQL